MSVIEYIDRSMSRFMNEYDDEIEMEVIKYHDHYKVVVTICQDVPPFKDFIGIGLDRWSGRRAARKALKDLYLKAYWKEKIY